MQGSSHVIIALESATGNVVGFINAISDGVLSAYIPLLEVLPDYQHQGIGKELVRRMLDRLKEFYMIDLTCDAELQQFYTHLEMIPSQGMMIRNYGTLSNLNDKVSS
ncbi:GNAT family N-acetyltransferase [Calditrichota bacterium]